MNLYKRPIRKPTTKTEQPAGRPVSYPHDLCKPSEKGKRVYKVCVHYCDGESDMWRSDIEIEADNEIDAELIAEQVILKENEPLSVSVISSSVIKEESK